MAIASNISFGASLTMAWPQFGSITVLDWGIFSANDFEIPFAAVGIIKKNIGTTSSGEGTFSFVITVNELDDFLEISSIGFETFKINVRNYLNGKQKIIKLKEKFTSLNEVVAKSPIFYVKSSLKKLKENTISSNHQLNMIYRRWSVEDNICRFLIYFLQDVHSYIFDE